MPYRQSRARKRFDLEAQDLLKTIRVAHSPDCKAVSVRELALCSAVLLCSAKMESYLQELLGDWAISVSRSTITTDRLPRSVRAYLLNHSSILAAYRNFVAYQAEGSFLQRIGATIGQSHYEFAIDGRRIPSFIAARIYEGRKYPSPENLQHLFTRFGIGSIFNDLNREAKRDTKSMLVSFNDLRTEMAHTGMPVGLNDKDVKAKLEDIVAIVRCIDRVFCRHVRSYLGEQGWMT